MAKVNQGARLKGTAEFQTLVNSYSLSQSGFMIGSGIGADAQPSPSPDGAEKVINDYSLSKCPEKFGKSGDNINEYSLSKLGKGLS